MLFVRFSFCECGSVVCMSPRPAQRNVLASVSSGGERERRGECHGNERGAYGSVHGFSSRYRGQWVCALGPRRTLPCGGDHSAARGAAG